MQKGQAVLEFIFLILIIVVYLVTTTMPLVKDTQEIIQDTDNIARANNECQKIVNTISEINLFSTGSKQLVTLFIPSNTSIRCDSGNDAISFTTKLTKEPFPTECPQGMCTKTFYPGTNIQCALGEIKGPQKANVTIQKTDTEINFLRSE
jgi:hypothetical protein